ncbi:hypothetical protein GUJ93_ZPchr0007g3076 [Zizania palustris]|uniref:Uncharacterized protein n=1 Tax=Zizania palustris TaxID=103762 RepID=A0A8J5W4H2_ZIZPA|nr:hypothetical protein GUJ93_ZPchr0007g3076 [Zizania palustris]
MQAMSFVLANATQPLHRCLPVVTRRQFLASGPEICHGFERSGCWTWAFIISYFGDIPAVPNVLTKLIFPDNLKIKHYNSVLITGGGRSSFEGAGNYSDKKNSKYNREFPSAGNDGGGPSSPRKQCPTLLPLVASLALPTPRPTPQHTHSRDAHPPRRLPSLLVSSRLVSSPPAVLPPGLLGFRPCLPAARALAAADPLRLRSRLTRRPNPRVPAGEAVSERPAVRS